MPAPIIVADSITRVAEAAAAGAVVVNASHGGLYAAHLAAELGVAAVIFNDAGVGRDEAGVGGLAYLQDLGIAAATVGHDSARIGDGADTQDNGIISHANPLAVALGVVPGQLCAEAASRLTKAARGNQPAPAAEEAAILIAAGDPEVWALDSASLVSPAHRRAIVVTGSHGGVLGGRPETALKYDVLGAIFNDAGIGKDGAGASRLPALDSRGIAAATVSADSARIGDAISSYEDGVVSRVNARAAALGLTEGLSAREFVSRLRAHFSTEATP